MRVLTRSVTGRGARDGGPYEIGSILIVCLPWITSEIPDEAAIAIPELEQALQDQPGGHPRYEQSEEGRAVGGLHGETRSLRSPLASASFPPQPIER